MSGNGLFGDEGEQRPTRVRLQLRSKSALVLLLFMPAFYAVMLSASWSLVNELVLGESFGLSGGRSAPWPGDFGLVWLTAFWLTSVVERIRIDARVSQVILILGWLGTFIAWTMLEPVYNGNNLISDPVGLVNEDGFLIPPLLISLVLWWFGMQLARDLSITSPEEFRGITQRSWVVIGVSILIAAWLGGGPGGRALDAAKIAVPALAIASLALIAGAEVQATRRLALRRGGQPPDWNRWLRLVTGISAIVISLTVAVLVVLSPSAITALIAGLWYVARLVGWGIRYILLALIFVVYQIVLGITWVLESIFGNVFGPIKLPDQATLQGQQPQPMRDQQEPSAMPFVTEFRWILLILTVAVLALIIFRLTRRFGASDEGEPLDEQRDSVFSADLARRQLRNLFRRGPRAPHIPPLDLASSPQSVRQSMLYLQTLAGRQDSGRADDQTADDFIRQLRARWPGLGQPLHGLVRRYERVRYGDESRDLEDDEVRASGDDWQQIWSNRKDVPPPQLPTPEL